MLHFSKKYHKNKTTKSWILILVNFQECIRFEYSNTDLIFSEKLNFYKAVSEQF